jgi:hypothetical protein
MKFTSIQKFAVAVCFSIVVVVVKATGQGSQLPPEPVYDGKTLSDWSSELMKYNKDEGGFQPPDDCEEVLALRSIGAAAVPYLLNGISEPMIMDQPESPLKAHATYVFMVLGERAKSAIPGLAQKATAAAHEMATATNDWQKLNSQEVFNPLVESLSYLGTEAAPTMLMLATNLPTQESRMEVIRDMGNLGTNGDAAISALKVWYQDKNSQIHECALTALIGIGKEPYLVLPVLQARLKDPAQRLDAAVALGSYGKAAKPTIPLLIKYLRQSDSDWRTREQIMIALGYIGEEPDKVVPALTRQLHDKDDDAIRNCAAYALGIFGGDAAYKVLLQATNDSNVNVRSVAFESLQKINSKAAKKIQSH